jgi:hypothetical protein
MMLRLESVRLKLLAVPFRGELGFQPISNHVSSVEK